MILTCRKLRRILSIFSCEWINAPFIQNKSNKSNFDKHILIVLTCEESEKIVFLVSLGCHLYSFYKNERDPHKRPGRHGPARASYFRWEVLGSYAYIQADFWRVSRFHWLVEGTKNLEVDESSFFSYANHLWSLWVFVLLFRRDVSYSKGYKGSSSTCWITKLSHFLSHIFVCLPTPQQQ